MTNGDVPVPILETVDWEAAVDAVRSAGWVHLPRVLSDEAAARLREVAPDTWHVVNDSPDGREPTGFPSRAGSVVDGWDPDGPLVWPSSYSLGTGSPKFGTWDERVVAVAEELARGVSAAATVLGFPELPMPNVVNWNRYPKGAGYIGPHRDPDTAGGVVAVFTLEGRAPFHAGLRSMATVLVTAGDLVLLRGGGWPEPGLPTPWHAVDPPNEGDRVIMTLRHNVRGADASYF